MLTTGAPFFQTQNTHFSWAKLLSNKSACMQVSVQCILLFNRHDKVSLSINLCPLLYCSVSSRTEFKQGGWMLILLSLNIIIMDIILAIKRNDLLYRHNHAMCTWIVTGSTIMCACAVYTSIATFLSWLWEAKDTPTLAMGTTTTLQTTVAAVSIIANQPLTNRVGHPYSSGNTANSIGIAKCLVANYGNTKTIVEINLDVYAYTKLFNM